MPWPTSAPTALHRAAFADAEPRSFWLAGAVDSLPALQGVVDADLCIVGGGFTGLWAALHAKADDPARDVVLLEAETAGFGASGRNGGFCVASLTHGIENGLARFAEEMEALERLGLENFDGLRADLAHHGIDCDFEPTGELLALTDAYQLPWLAEERESLERFGHAVTVLDEEAMRAEVHSPTYRRRRVGSHRRRGARPGQARAGTARRGVAGGRAGVRALGGARPARGRIGRRGADRVGAGAGAKAPAGDERLSPAAEGGPPLRRAGLRLRAGVASR